MFSGPKLQEVCTTGIKTTGIDSAAEAACTARPETLQGERDNLNGIVQYSPKKPLYGKRQKCKFVPGRRVKKIKWRASLLVKRRI